MEHELSVDSRRQDWRRAHLFHVDEPALPAVALLEFGEPEFVVELVPDLCVLDAVLFPRAFSCRLESAAGLLAVATSAPSAAATSTASP